MARPRNPNAKPNVGIVKRKQKDGSYLVFEKTSIYDPVKKNSKTIKEVRIGVLPADYKDEKKDLQPWIPKRRSKKVNPALNAATAVQDSREVTKVKYPLAQSLMTLLLAFLCGCTTCLQVEAFWRSNLNKLRELMPELPDSVVSHDTIRRFIMLLGRDEQQTFFHKITSPLIHAFRVRRVAIDGQAVRASTIDGHRHPYVFNAFDADNGLVLNQTLINAKDNEISQSIKLIESLDLRDCVLTADAMNTQKKLVQYLIEEKGCDYCLAVKSNHKTLLDLIEIAFSNAHKAKFQQALWESKAVQRVEKGHGRIENRRLRVLPASLIGQEICDEWFGLFYGTIIEAITETTDPKTGKTSSQTRYFISSLNFERQYIAEQIAHIVRGHWAIENQLHWNLDVCLNQDRISCRNADFLKGITSLNKISLNLQNKIKELIENEERKPITRPMLMRMLVDINSSFDLIIKTYLENLNESSHA